MFLYGLTTQEVKEMGYEFYLRYVPPEEQKMLVELNAAGFDSFEKIPVSERTQCTMSYDFHLMNGESGGGVKPL